MTAQMARVALDTVKAAANIRGSDGDSGTFLAKLKELDAASAGENAVGSD